MKSLYGDKWPIAEKHEKDIREILGNSKGMPLRYDGKIGQEKLKSLGHSSFELKSCICWRKE